MSNSFFHVFDCHTVQNPYKTALVAPVLELSILENKPDLNPTHQQSVDQSSSDLIEKTEIATVTRPQVDVEKPFYTLFVGDFPSGEYYS